MIDRGAVHGPPPSSGKSIRLALYRQGSTVEQKRQLSKTALLLTERVQEAVGRVRARSKIFMEMARPVWGYQLIASLILFLLIAPSLLAEEGDPRSFVILAINDVYRIGGVEGGKKGGLARVRSLRAELERDSPDLLVMHAGDFLFPSLLSLQYTGEQMIDVLNLLDGDSQAFDQRMFVTFGNHEFDKAKQEDATRLDYRIEDSQFRWLGSNIEFTTGADDRPVIESPKLIESAIIESGGIRVGLFSLTTDVKKRPAYVSAFRDYTSVAREKTAQLRHQGAEVVVALTHLRLSEDKALLHELKNDGPDLIIGGHEHEKQCANSEGRWVLKADADARSATVVKVKVHKDKKIEVTYEFRELSEDASPPDPTVQARVEHWFKRYDSEVCPQSGCLAEVVGKTQIHLVGAELEIRRFETNLGNWVADQALAAFSKYEAQAAFLNSGSLRLNQDIPAGSIPHQYIKELFAFPAPLKLLRITGATLQRVIDHAVEDWTGNGWWLQVSGFAYCYDPEKKKAGCLTLLTQEGPRAVNPDEKLLIVTGDYLVNSSKDQDGYTMLTQEQIIPTEDVGDLQQLVLNALKDNLKDGIAPKVEGRICNPLREGPCLAVGYEAPERKSTHQEQKCAPL